MANADKIRRNFRTAFSGACAALVALKRRPILRAKGEFEPFKILISAVFALLVLAIIVSAIQMFEQFRTNVSMEKFNSGIQNAKNQPNGDLLVMDNLFFENQTIFSARAMEKNTGLQQNCIELFAEPNSNFFLTSNETLIVKNRIATKVFARCCSNQMSCEVYCAISFGEPLNPFC